MNEISYRPKNINFDSFNKIYFDSENGSDSNDGLSVKSPLKSLKKMESIISNLSNDTLILIKCNSKYFGKLKINYISNDSYLYITSYGEGNMPIIDGNKEDESILVERQNITIDGLEITNKYGLRGILVSAVNESVHKDITIKNCHIHDVNWNEDEHEYDILKIDPLKITPNEKYYRETGGLIFIAQGEKENNFEDVFISNNNIHHVSRTGVIITGIWTMRPGTPWGNNHYYSDEIGWYPHKRFVIDHNKVDYCGGDSIVLIGALDSYIEYNRSYHSNFLGRTDNANAGIWPIGVKNIVIQYNEAAYGHLEHGGLDGEGFDLDIACENVLFQYNYAHHNDGGALLICNANCDIKEFDKNMNPVLDKNGNQKINRVITYWGNNIVKNNLSIFNGKEKVNPEFLHFSSNCNDLIVENNIVIISDKFNDQYIIRTADYANSGRQNNLTFKNNLFYSVKENNSSFFMDFADNYKFIDNIYSNLLENALLTSKEEKPITKKLHFDIPDNLDGFENYKKIIASIKEEK